jgi:glycosyltransferase involved in cell wall biosynthesis
LSKFKVVFYSIVPSPYQRDFFYELSCSPEVDLQVFYLEADSPDSPWTKKPLQPYEQVLPGSYLTWGGAHFYLNWHLPNLAQADIVVLNGYQNLTSQLILHHWANQIPCVFWGEKMVAASTGIKGKLQQGFAHGLNNCRAIVAIGSKAQADYRDRFPGKPIFNIPYYCNISQFSNNLPTRPRNPITILCCGQMIARKGIDLLLQAFERLIQSGLKARLLLVGWKAELPQMMQSLSTDVQQCIDYAGFQAPDALPQFFQQADLFVLPSRYDGWGVVVNQALGAGLPIICSDTVGAAYDLIEPGVNGCLFPSGNVDALTQALAGYLKHPQVIQAAGQASLRKSIEWSPSVGVKHWLEVFQALSDQSAVADSIPSAVLE